MEVFLPEMDIGRDRRLHISIHELAGLVSIVPSDAHFQKVVRARYRVIVDIQSIFQIFLLVLWNCHDIAGLQFHGVVTDDLENFVNGHGGKQIGMLLRVVAEEC